MIERFFADDPDREYVEAHALDTENPDVSSWTAFYRFRRIHIWLLGRRLLLPLVVRRSPPTLYHGGTWWALTSHAIRDLAERLERDMRVRRFLQMGFLVDEVLIPSLLLDSHFKEKVAGANLSFAE